MAESLEFEQLLTRGDISTRLQRLLDNDSELGSQLLSLLLINSKDSQQVIDALNATNTAVTAATQLEVRRKKNIEASARFRVRKKERYCRNLQKYESLKAKIKDLNSHIDELTKENDYWKTKLKNINDLKAKELLEKIKKSNVN